MDNKTKNFLLCLCLIFGACGCRETAHRRDGIFQVSSYRFLEEGRYAGFVSVAELARNGDFGIGTTDGLDGEMIVKDGRFWSVKGDGKLKRVETSELSPFGDVKFFKEDFSYPVAAPLGMSALLADIERHLPSKDAVYAVKIEGVFDSVKTRSIYKQDQPYKPLAEVIKGQSVFNASGVMGCAIGYYFPQFMSGLNHAGWHFHFIANDASFGGHVLDFRVDSGTVSIDRADDFVMRLPK